MSGEDAKAAPETREVIHVYPLVGQEHATDGEPCWCNPEIEVVEDSDGAVLVKHRLMS